MPILSVGATYDDATSASLALLVETPANGLAFLSLILDVAANALDLYAAAAGGADPPWTADLARYLRGCVRDLPSAGDVDIPEWWTHDGLGAYAEHLMSELKK